MSEQQTTIKVNKAQNPSGASVEHFHEDNRCCFCGVEDDHECRMCPAEFGNSPSPAQVEGLATAELLPCPFCGRSDKIHLRDIAGWELDCECGVSVVLNDDPSREGVVSHWNTRADSTKARGRGAGSSVDQDAVPAWR